MAEMVLAVENLVKRFGGIAATDHVNFRVRQGDIHAIIGPNGAGKTTLISQLTGEVRSDAGVIRFAGEDVTRLPIHQRSARGLARSFQISSIFHEFSSLDNVALAVQAHAGHSFRFWRAADHEERLRAPARAVLERVGLGDRAEVTAANLAHGEKRALEIAMALATGPRLLLLDEPMAGMGPEDSARMVRLLASLKGSLTIVLVEHDMDAVFALADRITVLVYGRVVATGTCEEISADLGVREAYLGEEAVV